MTKVDPYKMSNRWRKFKEKGYIDGITALNSQIIMEYLLDMELGFNVARTGGSSPIRLNNLKIRMTFVARAIEERHNNKNITDVTDKEIVSLFKDMKDGQIRRKDGRPYKSTHDYAKVFRAFWHWFQRVEGSKGNSVPDVTRYIDTKAKETPTFVYLDIADLKRLANVAKLKYKVLMWFLFDSGIRAPTELMNVRVSDLTLIDAEQPLYMLHIREETSKTFGRKIKLLLSSQLISEYIAQNGLKDDDCIFPICPKVVTQYLRRLAVKVLGDVKTKGGDLTSKLSMYDFRHSAACYWWPRYKTESALKYRFGWKKNDMIHYYTNLLGMQDTITNDDLILGDGKAKIEQDLEKVTKSRDLLSEQIDMYQDEMKVMQIKMSESETRDKIILKLIQGLIKSGDKKKIQEVLQTEDIAQEILELV